MAQETESYTAYPMFKGLQRPLEFMGLQGRYITWAAITAAVGILGFMLVYAMAGLRCGADHGETASWSSFQEVRQGYFHLCHHDEVMMCH